jgi:hypothetical protein
VDYSIILKQILKTKYQRAIWNKQLQDGVRQWTVVTTVKEILTFLQAEEFIEKLSDYQQLLKYSPSS